MKAPFVGRERELRLLRRVLQDGHSVVLTGAFGSGRTTLVHELARTMGNWRFVAWKEDESRRRVRAAVRDAAIETCTTGSASDPRIVVVVDGVVHLTAQRVRCLQEFTRTRQCRSGRAVASDSRQ